MNSAGIVTLVMIKQSNFKSKIITKGRKYTFKRALSDMAALF